MDRRSLLRGGLAGVGSAALLGACAPAPGPRPDAVPPQPVDPGPFDCGVASGVHSDSAVVLWTRFAPAASAGVSVGWQVATDPGFSQVVADGSVTPSPQTDGCAKVLAEGLAPGGTYWYRFVVDGLASPVGRTKTLPAAGTTPASVRLAVSSCQKYDAGFYPVWRLVADLDLDAVVQVGDYIYENPGSGVRTDPIRAVDLDSYRAKYRLYRSDPDLRAAHAAHPWAIVWDDHEFVNNFNRVLILDEAERAAAAFRVWWEYQPVWPIDGNRIYRRARWGDLVDLALLDTRQYRDPQPTDGDGNEIQAGLTTGGTLRQVHSPDRTILGSDQRDWFLDGFGAAQDDGVTWKLVGNQVMISPIRAISLGDDFLRQIDPSLPRNGGLYVNFDDWDGYQAERSVITEFLGDERIGNAGFLTGDIHMFWQSGLLRDHDERRSPTVAQEFVCGSAASTGLDGFIPVDQRAALSRPLNQLASQVIRNLQPRFRYADLIRRGVGIVECTPESTSVEFRRVNALRPTSGFAGGARFDWPEGSHRVAVSGL